MGVNDCQQTCINTAGSYYCDCTDGFQLDSDSHRCTGKCDNYLQKWNELCLNFNLFHSYLQLQVLVAQDIIVLTLVHFLTIPTHAFALQDLLWVLIRRHAMASA